MQARLANAKILARLGFTGDVPMPDISTKDKAQKYIGLDIPAEKQGQIHEEIVLVFLSPKTCPDMYFLLYLWLKYRMASNYITCEPNLAKKFWRLTSRAYIGKKVASYR